jgi:hypothetical protein
MANVLEDQGAASSRPGAAARNIHSPQAESSHSVGGNFEIRVKGHLDDSWLSWLEGLAMKRCENGEMILTGTIVDQAALLGILNKLNRLNLPLLSVIQVDQSDRH